MKGRTFSTALQLAGYFPKRVVRAPESLGCPAVADVCSLCCCLSQAPAGWAERGLHNDLYLYDTPELARRVTDDSGPYTIFAYRFSVVRFDGGVLRGWPWTATTAPIDATAGFRSLGFDAAGKDEDYERMFGHGMSPLSCERMAREYPVNAHCLLDDRDAAFAAAERFSIFGPEPGVYYVAEVLVAGDLAIATSPSPIP